MTDDARKAESMIDSWESVTLGTEARAEVMASLVQAFRESERAVWREAAETINGYAEQLGFSRHHAQLLADRLRQRAAEEA